MKLFRKKEKRSENTGTGEAAGGILTAFFGKNAVITKEQALEIPTVASCVTLIAERIAALPVKLYRQDGKKVTEILEDKRLNMLNHDTGDTINASEMKKLWVRDYFLSKGSYTYIERNMYNEPTAIYYVDESRVAIVPNSDPIHKTYAVQVSGRTFFPYEFIKILRFSKGYGTGRSIIDENPLALAIFYNTMKFENATIRKGGNKRGFLKAQSTVDKNAMDKLREAWQALYSNSNDSADNIVILNNGIDFKEASSTSVELQLNENKQTNAAEICKLFCIPVELLNGKATETQVSQFVQNCLMPAINTIEAALDHDLLTEAEKNGHYYFGIDTDELTRGDFATRMNAYAVAYEHNFYQLDEIREKEDLPPLDFNFIKLGLDAVLVDPKTREIYTPNTGKLEKMNAEHLTDEQLRAILENRGWATIKGHKVYIDDDGGSGGGGGKSSSGYYSKTARLDIEGVPFSTPTYYLPHAEFKEVCSAITSDDYEGIHEGKPFSQIKMNNKTYFFENRRKGDYNIYKVIDDE